MEAYKYEPCLDTTTLGQDRLQGGPQRHFCSKGYDSGGKPKSHKRKGRDKDICTNSPSWPLDIYLSTPFSYPLLCSKSRPSLCGRRPSPKNCTGPVRIPECCPIHGTPSLAPTHGKENNFSASLTRKTRYEHRSGIINTMQATTAPTVYYGLWKHQRRTVSARNETLELQQ